MVYDVLVLGGGASGLCAAVELKKRRPDAAVAIVEQLPRVGKKLITTGNGRCNITNRQITPDRYHGENPKFAEYALFKYDNEYITSFFADLGVVFTYEGDKGYPYSLQASSVVDALRLGAQRLGAELIVDTKVYDFEFSGGLYTLKAENKVLKSKFLIIAAGLLSGGDKLGSDGKILKLMQGKGYRISKTTPAIVQLKTENAVTKSLKGIKVNAAVTLTLNGKAIGSDKGEVLFCDYGLSGPPIMQLSRETSRQNGEFYISLDLMPDYDFSALKAMLKRRADSLRLLKLEDFFTGMLNKRVGQAVLKQAGFNLQDSVETLNDNAQNRIAEIIKNFRFKVTGNTGYLNSQVTAGGLLCEEFDSKTMMSKRHKGLFCVGEILDIDGDCGGFNLRWAWSSALCAANAAADMTGD